MHKISLMNNLDMKFYLILIQGKIVRRYMTMENGMMQAVSMHCDLFVKAPPFVVIKDTITKDCNSCYIVNVTASISIFFF